MSTVAWTDRWVERIGDWANPILLKETRQALKSRQFIGAFMLLLAAAWLIAVLGILDQGSALEFGSAGRDFFLYFYIAVAVATMVIVPFGAFRSLQGERDFNTFELLSITALTPRQIVWGKLFSALVQLLIFYSAVTPFIAFSSLLQGFDVPRFVLILAGSLVVSLLLSMAALMLSTLGRQRMTQGLLALATLFGLSMTCIGAISFVGESVVWGHFDMLPITEREFWEVLGILLVVGISYFVLFQQVTVAQLTFESDNHSTGVRLTTMVQFWLLWAGLIVGALYKGLTIELEVPIVLATMTGIHWFVFGGIMATEADDLSHRVRRGLPRSRFLRLLYAPLLPGGSRGYLNLLLQMATLWWIVVGAVAFLGYRDWRPAMMGGGHASMMVGGDGLAATLGNIVSGSSIGWNPVVSVATAIACYLLFYIGVTSAIGRWGMSLSHEIRPVHVRVIGVFIVIAGIIWPYIPRLADIVDQYRFSIIDVTNPFWTGLELAVRSSPSWDVLTVLFVAAAIGVLLNARAMWRGVAEVVRDEPRRVERRDPALEERQNVPYAAVVEDA